MKVTCPDNPDHKRFGTVAHEVHDWIIDENAQFVKDLGCSEMAHGPTKGNTFTCCECGAEAIVED
jgi:hypothetical protein